MLGHAYGQDNVGQLAGSTDGYERYSHTLNLEEFNCFKKQRHILAGFDYDTDGKVLGSYWTLAQPSANLRHRHYD